VAVLSVRNNTVYELENIRFGGILQRLAQGPQTCNVPAVLHDSFVAGLKKGGYTVVSYRPADANSASADFTKPLPEGSPALPFDAILLSTINSWYSAGSGQWKASMGFEVKLYHVPTAELLYSAEGNYARTAAGLRGPSSHDLCGDFVRFCARRSLASLPAASE
jgi:hypothetical protein